MTAGESYRPDIDGLRSVAVLLVVLFHFGVPPFSGGFTGVDVFFVISGYLITSILARDIEAGRFSILTFYARRARRILPAMLVVIAASILAGYFLLDASAFGSLTRSAQFSALGLANFYFLWSDGYFDKGTDDEPLLHLWSLGVEEQFYLVWPLLLAGVAFASWRAVPWLLLAIIAGSFAWSVAITDVDPTAAFFRPDTRAWELGLGAILVFLPALRSRLAAEGLSLLGLILIGYGAVALGPRDPFPGINALYPCIGTALLVWPKGRPTLTSRVLSIGPNVFVGKISYSLYLWHWPLLAFYQLYAEPTAAVTVLLIGACAMISVLSWRFVEMPARTFVFPSRAIVGTGLAAMAFTWLFAAGADVWRRHQQQSEILRIASFDQYKNSAAFQDQFPRACYVEPRGSFDPDACLRLDADRPNYLLTGDSHAAHLWKALSLEFPQVNFLQATAAGCRMFRAGGGDTPCAEMRRFVFDKFLPNTKLDGVLIGGRWKAHDAAAIVKTVRAIQQTGHNVTVFGPTIEYDGSLPLLLAAEHLGNNGLTSKHRLQYQKKLDAKLRTALKDTGATYVSVIGALCKEGTCDTMVGGVPVAFDYGHSPFRARGSCCGGLEKATPTS
jgi:peptidoglycan/LPS O-acetylase OafA/YrhL